MKKSMFRLNILSVFYSALSDLNIYVSSYIEYTYGGDAMRIANMWKTRAKGG